MVSKTMTKTKDAAKVQVNNRTSTAHNVQSRLPELFGSNHRQGGKRHRETERYPVIRGDFCSIGLWSLVVVVLTGLFVFQSPQNSYARVVSPSGVPVSTGNPMALPRGVGGYGHNPLVDYQNPYAPQVKGQVGQSLNKGASQLLDQHLPQTAQTGLQEMTDRLVKSADSLFGPDPRTYKSPFVTGGEDNGRDWSNGTRYGPSRLPGMPNPARTSMSGNPQFECIVKVPDFNEYGPGSAFAGVYNPATGSLVIAPFNNNRGTTRKKDGTKPSWNVDAHGEVQRLLKPVENTGKAVGFTVILGEDGKAQIRWTSRSVNGWNHGDKLAPQELRPDVIEALKTKAKLSDVVELE
jgi:hypothetical protein